MSTDALTAHLPGEPVRYVRAKTLAKLLDVTPSTLWRWVAAGTLPAPHKIGPAVTAWNLSEVEAALRAADGTV